MGREGASQPLEELRKEGLFSPCGHHPQCAGEPHGEGTDICQGQGQSQMGVNICFASAGGDGFLIKRQHDSCHRVYQQFRKKPLWKLPECQAMSLDELPTYIHIHTFLVMCTHMYRYTDIHRYIYSHAQTHRSFKCVCQYVTLTSQGFVSAPGSENTVNSDPSQTQLS